LSDNIHFRGASIRYIDVRQGKEGGDVYCRIHMSAAWSDQVRDKMEWDAIPDSITECKLTGSLLATNFILTPGDKQLKQYELNFDISSVEDFQVKCEKDDEGEIKGRRLDFIVRTPKEVEGFLGNYIRRVGRHEGMLKIRYQVQEQLDLNETKSADPETKPAGSETEQAEEQDTGCILCNNGVPFEDAPTNLMHSNGSACTRGADGGSATLASAREVNGSTHQRKRQQRRRPESEVDQAIADAEAAAEAEAAPVLN